MSVEIGVDLQKNWKDDLADLRGDLESLEGEEYELSMDTGQVTEAREQVSDLKEDLNNLSGDTHEVTVDASFEGDNVQEKLDNLDDLELDLDEVDLKGLSDLEDVTIEVDTDDFSKLEHLTEDASRTIRVKKKTDYHSTTYGNGAPGWWREAKAEGDEEVSKQVIYETQITNEDIKKAEKMSDIASGSTSRTHRYEETANYDAYVDDESFYAAKDRMKELRDEITGDLDFEQAVTVCVERCDDWKQNLNRIYSDLDALSDWNEENGTIEIEMEGDLDKIQDTIDALEESGFEPDADMSTDGGTATTNGSGTMVEEMAQNAAGGSQWDMVRDAMGMDSSSSTGPEEARGGKQVTPNFKADTGPEGWQRSDRKWMNEAGFEHTIKVESNPARKRLSQAAESAGLSDDIKNIWTDAFSRDDLGVSKREADKAFQESTGRFPMGDAQRQEGRDMARQKKFAKLSRAYEETTTGPKTAKDWSDHSDFQMPGLGDPEFEEVKPSDVPDREVKPVSVSPDEVDYKKVEPSNVKADIEEVEAYAKQEKGLTRDGYASDLGSAMDAYGVRETDDLSTIRKKLEQDTDLMDELKKSPVTGSESDIRSMGDSEFLLEAATHSEDAKPFYDVASSEMGASTPREYARTRYRREVESHRDDYKQKVADEKTRENREQALEDARQKRIEEKKRDEADRRTDENRWDAEREMEMGASAEGIGNVLDKEHGQTPYGDRTQKLAEKVGMEVPDSGGKFFSSDSDGFWSTLQKGESAYKPEMGGDGKHPLSKAVSSLMPDDMPGGGGGGDGGGDGGGMGGFKGMKQQLSKLMPTMAKYWQFIALLSPMLITLMGNLYGVAAAMGSVAAAGGAVLGLGLLGFGNTLSGSMKAAKAKIKAFKKELYQTFQATFQSFAPFTDQFLSSLPGRLAPLADAMKGLTAFVAPFNKMVNIAIGSVTALVDTMVGMSGLLSQMAVRGTKLLGQLAIKGFAWLTKNAYKNQDAMLSVAKAIYNVLYIFWKLAEVITFVVAVISPLVGVIKWLASFISTRWVAALMIAIGTVAALTAAVNALTMSMAALATTSLGSAVSSIMAFGAAAYSAFMSAAGAVATFLSAYIPFLTVTTGGAALGLAAVGIAAGVAAYNALAPKGASGGPKVPSLGGVAPSGGMGMGGSSYGGGGGSSGGTVVNIKGDVTKKSLDHIEDELRKHEREKGQRN